MFESHLYTMSRNAQKQILFSYHQLAAKEHSTKNVSEMYAQNANHTPWS